MPGGFKERGPFLGVYLVDVGLGNDEPLANLEVLLHARQSEGGFSSGVRDSRVGAEFEKQFHD